MSKVAACILALALIFTGVIFYSSSSESASMDKDDVKKLSKLEASELKEDEIYFAKELVVIDEYSSSDKSHALLVTWKVGENRHIVGSLSVKESADAWDEIEEYLEDEDKETGDLVLKCYVEAAAGFAEGSTAYKKFDKAVDKSDAGEALLFTQLNNKTLHYVCDEDGDPFEGGSGADSIGLVMGIIFIAGGLLILIFGVFKKSKKAPATTAPVQQPVEPVHTPPVQPVQKPQQPEQKPAGEDPVVAQLNRYKALRDAGYLSEEEFEQKRRELLGL